MARVAAQVDFPLLPAQERAPIPLRETALRFAAFSATGGPVDSLLALRALAVRQGTSLVPESDRAAVLTALLADDMAVAYTAIPAGPGDPEGHGGNPFHAMLRMLAGGDSVGARRALGEWQLVLGIRIRRGVSEFVGHQPAGGQHRGANGERIWRRL